MTPRSPDAFARSPQSERRTGTERRLLNERRIEWTASTVAREVQGAQRQLLDELDHLLDRWSLEGRCPNDEIKSVVAKFRKTPREPPTAASSADTTGD